MAWSHEGRVTNDLLDWLIYGPCMTWWNLNLLNNVINQNTSSTFEHRPTRVCLLSRVFKALRRFCRGFRSQEQMRWTMAIWRLSRTSHHIGARINAKARSAFGVETCFPMFHNLRRTKNFSTRVSLNRIPCFQLQSLTKKADQASTRTDT